jgi:hypothetical protein
MIHCRWFRAGIVRNEPKHWQQTCQTKASGKAAEDQRSYDGELAADAYRKYHPNNTAAVGPVMVDSQDSLLFLKFKMFLTARARAHRFERAPPDGAACMAKSEINRPACSRLTARDVPRAPTGLSPVAPRQDLCVDATPCRD